MCLTNSDGISFPPAWSHMATAKKADRRKILAKHCKATARQLQVIDPLISPFVLERADTLEWRIDNPNSWWSGLSPFLVLSLPPSEASKHQDRSRTWDDLHAGSHAPTLAEIDTFKVGQSLPTIVDCSTAEDTAWVYCTLLGTLLGTSNPIVLSFVSFLQNIGGFRSAIVRASTSNPMFGKYFLQWIRVIMNRVWIKIEDIDTLLVPSFDKLQQNLENLQMKPPSTYAYSFNLTPLTTR